jgi:hypothetical protein
MTKFKKHPAQRLAAGLLELEADKIMYTRLRERIIARARIYVGTGMAARLIRMGWKREHNEMWSFPCL